jgi:hypothetical protein
MAIHLVAGALLDDLLEFNPRGKREVVDPVAGIADKVVVLLRLGEAETSLAGAEGQLAKDAFRHKGLEGTVHRGQAYAGVLSPEPDVKPVHGRVNGILLQERQDGLTVLEGSCHGHLSINNNNSYYR